jgi:hypothetical protein
MGSRVATVWGSGVATTVRGRLREDYSSNGVSVAGGWRLIDRCRSGCRAGARASMRHRDVRSRMGSRSIGQQVRVT